MNGLWYRIGVRRRAAFTIVELMVAVAVLAVILAIAISMMSQVTNIWRDASRKIDAFESARLAFNLMTRQLSHATLNSYIDYDSRTAPKHYLRKSDLKFLIGPSGQPLGGNVLPGTPQTGQCIFFISPASRVSDTKYAGMASLLNACGYYISFEDTTKGDIPQFIQDSGGQRTRYRFCLMQLVIPTDVTGPDGAVYPFPAPAADADWQNWQTFGNYQWFSSFVSGSSAFRPVSIADNVIALIIRARDPSVAAGSGSAGPDLSSHNPSAPDFIYDSTENASVFPQVRTANQLPPVLQVTMIAIAETSAERLENGENVPSAIGSALASRFTEATKFDSDLSAVEAALSNPGSGHIPIQYRVFQSTVQILGSKWTK